MNVLCWKPSKVTGGLGDSTSCHVLDEPGTAEAHAGKALLLQELRCWKPPQGRGLPRRHPKARKEKPFLWQYLSSGLDRQTLCPVAGEQYSKGLCGADLELRGSPLMAHTAHPSGPSACRGALLELLWPNNKTAVYFFLTRYSRALEVKKHYPSPRMRRHISPMIALIVSCITHSPISVTI